MDIKTAVDALASLAHARRLNTFRLLVTAGQSGLPAGDIARALDIPNNTLSTHLAILTRAGLLEAQRNGRQIFYRANFDGMRDLLSYLLEDCCKADAAVTQNALAGMSTACCPPLTDQEFHR